MIPPKKTIDFKRSPSSQVFTSAVEDENEILTPALENLHKTLAGCRSKKLEDWDVSPVRDFSGLFEDYPCDIPEGISNWNTSNAENMEKLFFNCKGKIPNLNKWDTRKVRNMSWAFSGSEIRTTIKICDSWNTVGLEVMVGTFSNCKLLETFNCKWNTSKVIEMSNLFAGCSLLKNFCPWFNTKNVESMAHMFQECSSLITLKLPFITSSVTTMAHMFDSCSCLRKIEMESFNTAKVHRFAYMFAHCGRLEEIYTGPGFVDEWGFDMTGMFLNCSKIVSPPISKFKLNDAYTTESMFEGCESAIYFFIEKTTMLQVKYAKNMFRNCSSLIKLPIRNWNTKSLSDASSMFYGCKSLVELDCRYINTENITDLSYMFAGCKKLSNVNMSNFDLRNAVNMAGMFEDCISLTSLDFRNANQLGFDSLDYFTFMFAGCLSLSTIRTRLNYHPTNEFSLTGMTDGCMSMMAGRTSEQIPLPPVVIRPRNNENNENDGNNEEDSDIESLWRSLGKK